jgi:hypothetical protein
MRLVKQAHGGLSGGATRDIARLTPISFRLSNIVGPKRTAATPLANPMQCLS